MFGGDLPSLDPFTRSLLTNADVIAVNQHSTGNKVAYRQGLIRAWTASAEDSPDRYIAVFNLADSVSHVNLSWRQVGIDSAPKSIRTCRQLRLTDRKSTRLN